MKVNYYFDTFNHLNSFDILSYDDVVSLYLKNHNLLNDNGTERLGGWNEQPINSDVDEIEEDMVRHIVLNTLRIYKKRFQSEYGELVLTYDGGKYWRKDIFPYYKAARKEKQNNSHILFILNYRMNSLILI
mgnify:CR=1 FL=1